MKRDSLTGEVFARVVGHRRSPTIGESPSRETRAALTEMARYRTRAPKGVFVYRSHEEANAARDGWTVDAIVEAQNAPATR